MIIDTGNGLLAVWQLEEPFEIRDQASRDEATRMFKAFQGELRQVAKDQFGWDLDGTADLSRLIRVAGTLNHKSTPPKPVEIWR